MASIHCGNIECCMERPFRLETKPRWSGNAWVAPAFSHFPSASAFTGRAARYTRPQRDCVTQEGTMAEINVTAWGTREPLQDDPGAPMHDCLWEIAQEQAVLDRMKQTNASWDKAGSEVSPRDIKKHLDTICDDNGFRRLDGSGNGRNPNLIHDGERIKVRIDPAQLDKPASGVTRQQSDKGGAYNKAVATDDNTGVDLNKKTALDTWLGTVPGFPTLSDGTKTSLINVYDMKGMNKADLAKLGGNAAFRSLDEKQQQQLLTVYGTEGKGAATSEVNKIVGLPAGDDANVRMKVFGSQGYFKMDDAAQKIVLDRYNSDAQFKTALNDIVGQDNFKTKNSTEQAHALDILGRYGGRKGEGYGEQPEDKRKTVLVTLYNDVLAKQDFNLNHYGDQGHRENGDQSKKIEDFANTRASQIAGTSEPEPKETQRDYGSTD
jgi:hypothetical protein